MQQQSTAFGPLTLVGLTVRTQNAHEMNPDMAKIGTLVAQYHQEKIADHLQHRAQPGVTYCAYTDYESDETGEYTFFIGEAVITLEGQDLNRLQSVTVPQGTYQKFTTPSGQMPKVAIDAWQAIWVMDEEILGGKRAYRTDVEVYDQRALDPTQTVLDIYIGLV